MPSRRRRKLGGVGLDAALTTKSLLKLTVTRTWSPATRAAVEARPDL